MSTKTEAVMVTDDMCRAFYETQRSPNESPAGGFTRWASWEEARPFRAAQIEAGFRAMLAARPATAAPVGVEAVEAIAKAHWESERKSLIELDEFDPGPWENAETSVRLMRLTAARAILASLRSPEPGGKEVWRVPCDHCQRMTVAPASPSEEG